MGEVPELAVTATLPSALSVKPNGWGATSTDFPAGVKKRPLGITVFPVLLICVYRLPDGEETTLSFGNACCACDVLSIRQKTISEKFLKFMAFGF
jgi:hypothetical protein